MSASLGCGALSAKSTAGLKPPWLFFVSLGVTLDSAETPLLKPLFLAPDTCTPRCFHLWPWNPVNGYHPEVSDLIVQTILLYVTHDITQSSLQSSCLRISMMWNDATLWWGAKMQKRTIFVFYMIFPCGRNYCTIKSKPLRYCKINYMTGDSIRNNNVM